MYRRSLLIGVLLAGMLAAPVPVQGGEWVFFRACGFLFAVDQEVINGSTEAIEAPNIRGFWIPQVPGIVIVDWKTHKGLICTSLYLPDHEQPFHVLGTTEEVLEKLRHE